MDLLALVVIALVLLVVFLLARKGRQRREQESMRRGQAQEASRLLKDINRSLGFPEGTGPTGVMVDGEYRVVNVGHTERMQNDPTYAFGDKMAEMLLEMNDLEGVLKEAIARSDDDLAAKVRAEISSLEKRAIALAEKQRR